jgi:hypothetical protein
MQVIIDNHGQLITASNYWDTDLAREGKVFVSPNAGAIRVLLPPLLRPVINELRKAEYAILSRGPWYKEGEENGIEILWEDHTDAPHAWHLTQASCAMLPAKPPDGQEWVITLWDRKKGKPHKCLERVCHWRAVPKIPWLKPWEPPSP